MRIRNGFVSNSSSSSFIVAVKDKKLLDNITSEFFGIPSYSYQK